MSMHSGRLSDAAAPLIAARGAVGRQLLSLVFPHQDDQSLPDGLAALARDPGSQAALAELDRQLFEAFEADPALAAEAVAVITAFYRQRADTGEVTALVELGSFLYWDEPGAARVAYQQAIDAGHRPALIELARLLLNVIEDEETALTILEEAAASDDADLRAEAMSEIAEVQLGHRDAAAGRATLEWVIATRHPVWAATAMVRLSFERKRQGDTAGAEALLREAVAAGDADCSARALCLLGDLLEKKGDAAGAKAAWQRVIDSRDPEWAGPALLSLVNLLAAKEDADGLRTAYGKGAALGNPDAPSALRQLGALLEAQGDVDDAHAVWQQAIDAGCDDPDSLREQLAPEPRPEPQPEPEAYPPGLPPEFDPRNMIRTGLDVLKHGLPPLPAVLDYAMAVPVACWKAEQCAVVLVLRFSRHGQDDPEPMAMEVVYSRGHDGGWEPPRYILGGSFGHDPVRSPGSLQELDGNPMVHGSSSLAPEVTPGHPAAVATGRAAPEVRYIAVIGDDREDRRPLESHFGAWIVCTEQPGDFLVVGLDANGTVLAVLPHSVRPPV